MLGILVGRPARLWHVAQVTRTTSKETPRTQPLAPDPAVTQCRIRVLNAPLYDCHTIELMCVLWLKCDFTAMHFEHGLRCTCVFVWTEKTWDTASILSVTSVFRHRCIYNSARTASCFGPIIDTLVCTMSLIAWLGSI